jgi:hypothetical protein
MGSREDQSLIDQQDIFWDRSATGVVRYQPNPNFNAGLDEPGEVVLGKAKTREQALALVAQYKNKQAAAAPVASAASTPPAETQWPVGMNPKWVPDKKGSRTGPGRLEMYGKNAGRFNSSTEAFAEVAKRTYYIEQKATAPAAPASAPAALAKIDLPPPPTPPAAAPAAKRPPLSLDLPGGVRQPLVKSVLDPNPGAVTQPAPAVTATYEDSAVVNSKFTQAVYAQLNAIPIDQRIAKLQALIDNNPPNTAMGRASRAVAARYKGFDASQSKALTKIADPRLEAQTSRFMEQGRSPEDAENDAKVQALQGQMRPDFDVASRDVTGELAGAKAAKTALDLKDANFAQRVGAEIKTNAQKTFLGLANLYGDFTGNSDIVANAIDSQRIVEAQGKAIPKGEGLAEKSAQGAVTSLAIQAPMVLLSMVTGTAAPMLAQIGLNAFFSEYGEGRSQNLDPAAAAARSAQLVAAELIFERFGMTKALAGLKAFNKNNPNASISAYFTKAIGTEVPAELATTLTQYAIDLEPGIGLTKQFNIKDLYERLNETLRQTVIQSGLQAGMAVTGVKAANAITGNNDPANILAREIDRGSDAVDELMGQPRLERRRRLQTAEEFFANLERKRLGLPPLSTNKGDVDERPTNLNPNLANVGNLLPPDSAGRVDPKGEVDISAAPGRAEPTGEVDISTAPGRTEPVMDKSAAVVAAEDRQTKINAKTDELRQNGIPKDNATPIATRLVDRELAQEAKLSAIGIPENRVEELTQGLIASGVNPQEAEVMARGIAEQEVKDDAEEGKPNVTRPITEPSGASVDVSGQPSTDVPPTKGTTETELGGVASTGSDVADTTVGESKKSDAVAEVEPTAEEKDQVAIKAEDEAIAASDAKAAKVESMGRASARAAFDQKDDSDYGGDIDAAIDSFRQNMYDTLEETRVERGERPEERDTLSDRADRAFDAEIKKLKAEAEAPTPTPTPAPTVAEALAKPAKPVKRTHSVAPATEGTGYVHSVNGEPVATYPTKAIANIAATLGRSQDKGDPGVIKTNADALAAAQTKQAGPSSAGRPKGPEKTPDQVAAKAATEKANRQADNIATNAIPLLADPSASVRETATYDLLKAQTTAATGGAVYNRIKQALKDVPPEVLTKVKNRIAAEVLSDIPLDNAAGKPLASAVSSLTASASKPNPKFEQAINASEAIGVVLADKNATAFQKFVARRLLNYVRGVEFVVIEKGEVLPPELQYPENKALWDNARGAFFGWQNQDKPGQRVIFIKGGSFGDASGINNVTVIHEILHAATNRRIITGGLAIIKPSDPLKLFLKELNDLQDTARRQYEKLVAAGNAPPRLQAIVKAEPNIFNSPDEFLAYGMSDPTFQEFLMGVQGKRQDASGFSNFVRSIRELYNFNASDTNAFTDLIDLTDKILGAEPRSINAGTTKARLLSQKLPFEELMDQFDSEADKKPKRTVKERDNDVAIALNKVETSTNVEDLAKGIESLVENRNAYEAKGMLGKITENLDYKALQQTVKLPTFNFLAEWAKDKKIPELVNTQVLLQRMIGESQQFLAGAEQIISGLKRGYKADPTLERKKFEAFVYATTLAEVDPSDTNARERSKVLDAKYAELGPTGQRMYKQVRDYYESVAELYSDLLDAQIQNIQGMSPDDKSKLMLVIRKTFESDARIRPYFPLVRRGDFWLAIGSGDTREFYLFESLVERNDVARKLAWDRRRTLAELEGDKEFELGNDLASLRAKTKDSSEMLKQVFSAIDGMSNSMGDDKASNDVKEGLKDAVYQIYLNTMPEQSFRKQFTHRKGRTGFSTDLQQNIATTAAKQAIQLSRLKYAPLLRNSVSAAKDSIAGRAELSPFVQEARRRVDMALSGERGGTGEAIAGAANKLSYVWYLSAASSALIQPTSVFLTGLPILAANHGDSIGAAKELAKMVLLINQYSVFRTNSDGSTSPSAPSIANSQSLSEDEREAVREMTARGVSQSTYASLVWGYKDMSTEQREGVMGKGKELANLMVGGLMHNTERLSREAVYLASYRMGRNRGLTHEQAISHAVSDTNEALGNYDMANRPRFMQEGIGKISSQFQMYPLHMLLLQTTNFKRMLPFLNEEGKTAAVTKFFGIMGTSIMLGGVSNAFLFSPIIGFLGWAWGKLEEEEDWPKKLKGLDFTTWFRAVFMPEKLGHVSLGGVPLSDLVDRGPLNAITGWGVASRVGLNDLPIVGGRDRKEVESAKEDLANRMLDIIGGPTASMVLSWGEAYDNYRLGDYQKMAEKASPAFIRNLFTAHRFDTEGAKTNDGELLIQAQNFKTGELIGQAIGFRPDILADPQQVAFRVLAANRRIENERNLILDKLDLQHRQNTKYSIIRFSYIVANEVAKFNSQYPASAITEDTIVESLEARAKKRAESIVGVPINEKTVDLFDPALSNMQRKLANRAKEMSEMREKEAKKRTPQ